MLNRREMIQTMSAGFGTVGMADMLSGASHFTPKAKHFIFLFLNGGPSQVDTFDPKPMLQKMHGKPSPVGNLKTERKTGTLLGSPFKFQNRRAGEICHRRGRGFEPAPVRFDRGW